MFIPTKKWLLDNGFILIDSSKDYPEEYKEWHTYSNKGFIVDILHYFEITGQEDNIDNQQETYCIYYYMKQGNDLTHFHINEYEQIIECLTFYNKYLICRYKSNS